MDLVCYASAVADGSCLAVLLSLSSLFSPSLGEVQRLGVM